MENKQPKVINEAGSTRLNKEASAAKEARENNFRGRGRRDNRRNRRATEEVKKEFDSVNISINRVSRTVKGGRRMRFQALVAVGNHKNKIGVGMAKGADVTSAVQKAERRAKKNMITVPLNQTTITHETIGEFGAGRVLMKPAAPGTGVIAGGPVRAVLEAAGIKDIRTKCLRSNNPQNVVSATMEGLKSLRSPETVARIRGKSVEEIVG